MSRFEATAEDYREIAEFLRRAERDRIKKIQERLARENEQFQRKFGLRKPKDSAAEENS